jgi:hypothetical protein
MLVKCFQFTGIKTHLAGRVFSRLAKLGITAPIINVIACPP